MRDVAVEWHSLGSLFPGQGHPSHAPAEVGPSVLRSDSAEHVGGVADEHEDEPGKHPIPRPARQRCVEIDHKGRGDITQGRKAGRS
jgi:hypothetical protein